MGRLKLRLNVLYITADRVRIRSGRAGATPIAVGFHSPPDLASQLPPSSGSHQLAMAKLHVHSDHHTGTPPKTECGCLHGGVTESGRVRNPALTLCSVLAHLNMYRYGCTYRVTLRVFS